MQTDEAGEISKELVPFLRPFGLYSSLTEHIAAKVCADRLAPTSRCFFMIEIVRHETCWNLPLQRLFLRRNLTYYAAERSAAYQTAE